MPGVPASRRLNREAIQGDTISKSKHNLKSTGLSSVGNLKQKATLLTFDYFLSFSFSVFMCFEAGSHSIA